MKILGIETSFDETAAAIVENGQKILSSKEATTSKLTRQYGGLVPEQAAREQIRCIIPVIQEVLTETKLKLKDVDAIACTLGPGLIGSLLVGVETAKTLGFCLKKPLVPVNHIKAHLYANFIHSYEKISFPSLGLIVSGGHTELFLIKNKNHFQWLGGTLDDAAGECLDKCARVLGFGYPGGPAIEKAALKADKKPDFKLPRPLIHKNNLNFSFSGLKTAFIKEIKQKPLIDKNLLAWELQEAVTDVLVKKTLLAAEKFKVKAILLGGGVAANQKLRDKLTLGVQKTKLKTDLFIPEKKLCTDNAIIVATAAFFDFKSQDWKTVKANPALEV